MRVIKLISACALSIVFLPSIALPTLTCISENNSFTRCGLSNASQRDIRITAVRTGDCDADGAWGVDSSSIWVNQGCGAVFQYTPIASSYNSDDDSDVYIDPDFEGPYFGPGFYYGAGLYSYYGWGNSNYCNNRNCNYNQNHSNHYNNGTNNSYQQTRTTQQHNNNVNRATTTRSTPNTTTTTTTRSTPETATTTRSTPHTAQPQHATAKHQTVNAAAKEDEERDDEEHAGEAHNKR